MADQTHLLDDPKTLAAVAVHSGVHLAPGHRVIGLHDNVLVKGWRDVVPTVEVVVASSTGRVYAQRYLETLDVFLGKARRNAAPAARTAA